MKPIPLRFFVDDGVHFPSWGDEVDPKELERVLPIPEDLRTRMRHWSVEWNLRTQEGVPGP